MESVVDIEGAVRHEGSTSFSSMEHQDWDRASGLGKPRVYVLFWSSRPWSRFDFQSPPSPVEYSRKIRQSCVLLSSQFPTRNKKNNATRKRSMRPGAVVFRPLISEGKESAGSIRRTSHEDSIFPLQAAHGRLNLTPAFFALSRAKLPSWAHCPSKAYAKMSLLSLMEDPALQRFQQPVDIGPSRKCHSGFEVVAVYRTQVSYELTYPSAVEPRRARGKHLWKSGSKHFLSHQGPRVLIFLLNDPKV